MKTPGAAAEVEAQRAVMFSTSRPYAFASRVRGEVPSQRRDSKARIETRSASTDDDDDTFYAFDFYADV
jgi:hypothetical protein